MEDYSCIWINKKGTSEIQKGKISAKYTGPNVFFLFRSSHRTYSIKKVFLKISQDSQENSCARVFFLIKLSTVFFAENVTFL